MMATLMLAPTLTLALNLTLMIVRARDYKDVKVDANSLHVNPMLQRKAGSGPLARSTPMSNGTSQDETHERHLPGPHRGAKRRSSETCTSLRNSKWILKSN